MALQGAVLKPAPNASDFIIYHRDKDGKPYEVYDPEHSISTCVVNSINICRGMLRAPKVRTALMKLAKAFCDERTDTWFCQGHATKEKMAPITDAFLGKVLAGFPYIIVDETLRNPSVMAIHWRHKFIGEFETSNQCIALNGLRVHHMLGAAVGEKTSTDKKNLVSQDYRNFLFTFASSILHEIGHVFFTYLLKGVGDTPSKIRAHLIGKEHDTEGECGRSLEQLVFGGVVSYWRDPITGNSRGDCGTAYLHTKDGLYRIKQETIDRTVKDGENSDFKFPYDRSGIKENDRLESIGYGMPQDDITNPLAHPNWPLLRYSTLYPEAAGEEES